MSVTNVVARMYDAGLVEAKSSGKVDGKDFDEVMNTAVQEEINSQTCRACTLIPPQTGAEVNTQSAVNDPIAVVSAGSAVVGTEPAEADKSLATEATATSSAVAEVSNEVKQSAMYRFTMFIRISGDFGAVQESLVDEFKTATKDFVSALKGDTNYGLNALDGYLNKADESASKGLQSSKSFLDDILAAADKGLKAITSSMTSSSWMSSLNLSSSSSSLTSAGPMDIARLQLQDALQKTSTAATTANEGSGKVSYGSGYELELVKGAADPVKVDSTGKAAGEKVDVESAADKDVIAVEKQTAQAGEAIAVRNSILDRFLKLLDGLSSSLGAGSSIVKARFSFEYNGAAIKESTEAGKVVEDLPVSAAKEVTV